jgi:hypothetical protein
MSMRLSKNNVVRLRWAFLYCVLSVGLFGIFVLGKIFSLRWDLYDEIIWCLGCSAFGIFLGLYNSRKDHGGNTSNWKHYLTYFIAVLVLAALSAFVMFGNSIEKGFMHAYASAMLVGIVVGFAGDKLAGKIFDLK